MRSSDWPQYASCPSVRPSFCLSCTGSQLENQKAQEKGPNWVEVRVEVSPVPIFA